MVAPGDRPDKVVREGGTTGTVPATQPRPRVFAEIEATAKYHHPGTYVRLLSYYNSLSLNQDPLNQEFIALSAVPQKAVNPKKFVIGILPPTANITGRLLDRSASVAAIEGIIPDVGGGARVEDLFGSGEVDETILSDGTAAGRSLSDEFWIDLVSMCERLGADPEAVAAVMYHESRLDPSAQAKAGINSDAKAKGLVQFIRSSAVPRIMTAEEWEKYQDLSAIDQLYFVEIHLRRLRVKGLNAAQIERKNFGGGSFPDPLAGGRVRGNEDGSLYASAEYQASYIAGRIKQLEADRAAGKISEEELNSGIIIARRAFPNGKYQADAYNLNKLFDKDGNKTINMADIEKAMAGLPPEWVKAKIREARESGLRSGPPGNPFGGPAEGERKPWVDDGSEQAKKIREQLYAIARTGLNATGLGKAFEAAQRATILATKAALDNMKNTPPLQMLVNPTSFSISGEKIVQDGNWSRTGPIIEHWGDNQDRISGQGQIAGFYSLDVKNASGPGLSRMTRNFSQSYQNFMSLYLLYRNNAGLWLTDSSQLGNTSNLSMVGSVYIYYDNILYLGSFDTFNITEDDTKPFTLNYTFEFVVRAAFLLDFPNDQGYTYGKPALFVQSGSTTIPTTTPEADIPTGLAEEGVTGQDVQDFIARDPLLSETPQVPGNEAGAKRTRDEIEAAIARLEERFVSGSISLQERDTRLRLLNEEKDAIPSGT